MTSDIKDDDVAGFNIDLTRWGSANKGLQWGRISDRCLKEETDVVGLKEQIDDLLNLVLIPEDDRSSQVIAVVGGSGSGKTTIVKNVYNKLLAMRNFEKSAWVHVPSMFKARYVLADILKQNNPAKFRATATVSEEGLHEELTETFRDKYFLVIEDVESTQVWDVLYRNHISSSRNFGNRIIITTCNDDVARHIACNSGGSILKVCQLNNQSSWELFLKKLQREEDILNESKLIKFKEQIVKVCGGLPSRIVLLGGLLYTKEGRCDEWSRVIELANKIGGDVFGLCYQELSSQVKPCFLYLGLFPRGFEIPVRRLIHLWLSDGLVTVPSGSDPATEIIVPEDLAEMYFEELVIRNMIQVRWRLDGSPKTCWMPHVLYDIFSAKAADEGFYHQLHVSSNRQPQFAVQRLVESLGIKNKSRTSILHLDVVNIGACVAFDTRMPCRPAMEIGTLLNKIISTEKGFRLLKILDLEGVYKPVLPDDAIGKLILLSYLGLRSTAIDSLPSSVGNLPCLETLDVKHTVIHDLPTSIWKAKKLRHLYLNWSCSSNFRSLLRPPQPPTLLPPPQPPTNLHTLWGLSIDDGGIDFLKSLTGLRKLGLTCTSVSTAEATAKWVSQLTKLQSLKLRSVEKGSYNIFDLKLPTMTTHHKLQGLYLLGKLSERWLTNVEFPPNLKMLTLSSSRSENDPMPVLGGLPHLHILRLSDIFSSSYTNMTFSRGGFPKLRVLKLWSPGARELIVEEGAMPSLRELEVRNCSLFLRQDTGLQHLTALKKVALINAPHLQVSHFVGSQERDLYVHKK